MTFVEFHCLVWREEVLFSQVCDIWTKIFHPLILGWGPTQTAWGRSGAWKGFQSVSGQRHLHSSRLPASISLSVLSCYVPSHHKSKWVMWAGVCKLPRMRLTGNPSEPEPCTGWAAVENIQIKKVNVHFLGAAQLCASSSAHFYSLLGWWENCSLGYIHHLIYTLFTSTARHLYRYTTHFCKTSLHFTIKPFTRVREYCPNSHLGGHRQVS